MGVLLPIQCFFFFLQEHPYLFTYRNSNYQPSLPMTHHPVKVWKGCFHDRKICMLIRAVSLVEYLGLCLDLQKRQKDPTYACPLGVQNQSPVIPSLEQPEQLAPCAFMNGVGVHREGRSALPAFLSFWNKKRYFVPLPCSLPQNLWQLWKEFFGIYQNP